MEDEEAVTVGVEFYSKDDVFDRGVFDNGEIPMSLTTCLFDPLPRRPSSSCVVLGHICVFHIDFSLTYFQALLATTQRFSSF